MSHKRINADTKLLINIAPYLNAHGHNLSTYEYLYTYWLAHYNLTGDKNALALSEHSERILRSFMVTKNLRQSVRLIEKEYGTTDGIPTPTRDVSYDDIKTEWAKWRPKILSNDKERAKVSKGKIDIAFEKYEQAWNEKATKAIDALKQVYEGAEKAVARIDFSETMSIAAVLTIDTKGNDFNFSLWRYAGGENPIGSGWLESFTRTLKTWPELCEADWEIIEKEV